MRTIVTPPNPKTATERPAVIPDTLTLGDWYCAIAEAEEIHINSRKPNRRRVIIKYCDELVYESHGLLAYLECRNLVEFMNARGYVPRREIVRCMADLAPGERMKCGIKQGVDAILPAHVGEEFVQDLPGLGVEVNRQSK